MQAVCRRFSPKFPLANKPAIDYDRLWKNFCNQNLYFVQKNLNSSWLQTFQTCCKTQNSMLLNDHKSKFNFKACSIRETANFVDLVDQHHNFVFLTDRIDRALIIVLINENDLENDDDSLVKWQSNIIGGRVVSLKFLPEFDHLVAISVEPYEIHVFKVAQTGVSQIEVDLFMKAELGFQCSPELLYCQVLDDKYFVLCPLPLDMATFNLDPQIVVYKAGDHKLTFHKEMKKYGFGYITDDLMDSTFANFSQRISRPMTKE